jgi:hypothetical protein
LKHATALWDYVHAVFVNWWIGVGVAGTVAWVLGVFVLDKTIPAWMLSHIGQASLLAWFLVAQYRAFFAKWDQVRRLERDRDFIGFKLQLTECSPWSLRMMGASKVQTQLFLVEATNTSGRPQSPGRIAIVKVTPEPIGFVAGPLESYRPTPLPQKLAKRERHSFCLCHTVPDGQGIWLNVEPNPPRVANQSPLEADHQYVVKLRFVQDEMGPLDGCFRVECRDQHWFVETLTEFTPPG